MDLMYNIVVMQMLRKVIALGMKYLLFSGNKQRLIEIAAKDIPIVNVKNLSAFKIKMGMANKKTTPKKNLETIET